MGLAMFAMSFTHGTVRAEGETDIFADVIGFDSRTRVVLGRNVPLLLGEDNRRETDSEGVPVFVDEVYDNEVCGDEA